MFTELVQKYLAHKKIFPTQDPGHRPTVGSERGAVSYERGTPVATLETTQGQIEGFFSQVPFRCYLPESASVGD